MSKKQLKPCPFCRHVIEDLRDGLHPTGTRWCQHEHSELRRHYIGYRDVCHFDNIVDSGDVWCLECLEHEGGCGVVMYGDSRDEVIEKWQLRSPSS